MANGTAAKPSITRRSATAPTSWRRAGRSAFTKTMRRTSTLRPGASAAKQRGPTVADEQTAPTGVTFLAAVNKAGGIALGEIPPGQTRAFWLRRTVSAGATVTASDPFTIRVEGETAA